MKKETTGKWIHRNIDGKKLGAFQFGRDALLFIAAVAVLLRFVIGVSSVTGDSMYPTLHDGQVVVYNRLSSHYSRGDVVSVKMPSGDYYVKRVVAVAGDTVDLKDGHLYVNGAEETGSYVNGETYALEGMVRYPYAVTEGKVFVVGDNRQGSVDSRAFGAVLEKKIQGKLLFQHAS